MKIKSIRAIQPHSPTAPDDWRTWLGQILVIIETEDGLTGYGVGGGGLAGIHVIETVFRHALVGQDATDVEDIWESMYSMTLAYGQKGLAIMAISGVDLALWDLRAKRANKPLVNVLSDDVRESVPTYKTGWSPEEVIADGAEGFAALKLHVGVRPGKEVGDVVAQIRKVRDTLGPDVKLMGDAFMKLDVEKTLQLADQLKDVNLVWIEEPLPADDLEGYARLRDECPIPISGGEHEYTAKAFEVLMRDRLHAIVQPDVNWCGGLTELVKIYEMGKKYDIKVCPHRGCEIWSLHAICALDPEPLAESGRPWMTWVGGQPEIVDGRIGVGEDVGFGVSFSDEDLKKALNA